MDGAHGVWYKQESWTNNFWTEAKLIGKDSECRRADEDSQ